MKALTTEGQQQIADIARRHNFGTAAVMSMLDAVIAGHGGMAQFHHAEFGGSGQWMNGGMTMVSDLFDHDLKRRVDALCMELAALVRQQPELARTNSRNVQTQSQFRQDGGEDWQESAGDGQPDGGASAPSGFGASIFETSTAADGHHPWWPDRLGQPDSTGMQNATRYAWFHGSHRLAIMEQGKVKIYDTLDHQIGGFSQQQSGGSTLAFSSQHGTIDLSSLPVVEEDAAAHGSGKSDQAQHATASPVPAASRPSSGDHEGMPAHEKSAGAHKAASSGGAHHDSAAEKENGSHRTVSAQHAVDGPTGAARGQADNHAAHSHDIFAIIEKLAELRSKGLLSEDEFAAKKTELLARL